MGFLKLKTNVGEVVHEVEEMAEHARDLRPVLRAFGDRMAQFSIPRNFELGGRPTKWKPNLRGGAVGQDHGLLAASIQWELDGRTLRVGTNRVYAPQFHFGGRIVPKNAKTLAIPLRRGLSSPRRYSNLQWAPGKSTHPHHRGVLGRYVGGKRKRRFVALFALRSEVTQPARPFLVFQEEDRAWAAAAIVRHVAGAPL